MRLRWLAGLLLPVALLGCDGDKPSASTQAGSAAPALAQDQELLAQRDGLQRERRRIGVRRSELAVQRGQGGDVAAVQREDTELATQEAELLKQENAELEKHITRMETFMRTAATGGAGPEGDVSRREAGVASRERDLSVREQRIGERESTLAAREEQLATKWKEGCAAGVTTVVREVEAVPRGAKYDRGAVESALARARGRMGAQAILVSDLPEHAQGLEGEAVAALGDGEFGKAKLIADQLAALVEGLKVDRTFVSGKIGRLNRVMKGKTLSPESHDLFRGATEDYGDGKFATANQKLNQILSSLR